MGPIEKDPYRRLVSSLFSLIVMGCIISYSLLFSCTVLHNCLGQGILGYVLYVVMDPYSLLLLSMGPELKRLVVATGPIIRVQY